MSTTNSESKSDHPEWERAYQIDGTSYYKYTGTIETFQSSGDGKIVIEGNEREYRLILLSNGIQAMLVHDPKCEQAAASLCVGAGYLDDPVSLRRLSIFHDS
jgi:hypothetical protein